MPIVLHNHAILDELAEVQLTRRVPQHLVLLFPGILPKALVRPADPNPEQGIQLVAALLCFSGEL